LRQREFRLTQHFVVNDSSHEDTSTYVDDDDDDEYIMEKAPGKHTQIVRLGFGCGAKERELSTAGIKTPYIPGNFLEMR
jgi:hypothetical protein